MLNLGQRAKVGSGLWLLCLLASVGVFACSDDGSSSDDDELAASGSTDETIAPTSPSASSTATDGVTSDTHSAGAGGAPATSETASASVTQPLASTPTTQATQAPGSGGMPEEGAAGGAGNMAGSSNAAGGAAGGAVGGEVTGEGGANNAELGLPEGSREYEHIVNLVNPDAVPEIEALLRSDDGVDGLPAAAKMFYEYYLDEYDFLILLTDHTVENAVATAAFQAVYRPAQAATGDETPTDRRLAHGSERLLGVIGGTAHEGAPPLEHEFAHYWAAHLNPTLGFGADSEIDHGSHWGLTSVYGQLGGFDTSSMACANPAGALPPDCTVESNGRTVYTFSSFTPYVNRFVDYAPLELYLMGLLPAAEVPDSFVRLEGATFNDVVVDGTTLSLEADGTSEILKSDILALHGEVPLKPETERHFTAAFVVVSAAPVSDEILANVAEWQEIFGNYVPSDTIFKSFEVRTGNRATLATRLGRRRTANDPKPNPPAPEACSVTEQNCAEGLACYGSMDRQCAVPGALAEGVACEFNTDCLPGMGCPNRLAACAPYCNPTDPSAVGSCEELCPGNFVQLVDDTDAVVGGYCLP